MARERYRVLHRMNFESPYVDVPMRLTVRQNLEVFGRLYGVRDLGARIGEIAAELRLADLLDRPYGKLSAGQKTRVSLAKALLNEPELLLLDEPTASLDPDTADWVRTQLEDYCRARAATVVLASHNMAEVERLADRVIMLEKGRIVADETPQELIGRFGRRNLEETFLAIARRGAEEAELQPMSVAAGSALHEQTGLAASARRVWAMVLRHWYVIRSSWPRTAELIYWPLVQMLTWGFLQSYLAQATSLAGRAAGLFIGGVLLWDILVRGQLGFSIAFLEELWSRNLGHLLMSPLRPAELIASLIVVSLVKLTVAMVPVTLMAYWFFGFNLLEPRRRLRRAVRQPDRHELVAWACSSAGVVLRWGLGAESFAWLVAFVLLPLCCVYYPVTTLPGWLQPVALALPPTYVFEGLRALVARPHLRGGLHGQGACCSTSSISPSAPPRSPSSCAGRAPAARWCRWGSRMDAHGGMSGAHCTDAAHDRAIGAYGLTPLHPTISTPR